MARPLGLIRWFIMAVPIKLCRVTLNPIRKRPSGAGRGPLSMPSYVPSFTPNTCAGTGFAWIQPGLGLPALARLVWRYSTVNERVTSFNGASIVKFYRPQLPKTHNKSATSLQDVLHCLGRREGQLLRFRRA